MIPPTGVPEDAAAVYEKTTTTLLCDCGCSPQSVKECACGRAGEMRASLDQDARAGKSSEEIIGTYVARYGQKILVSPPASGFNLVAWAGPAVGLLAAFLIIALMIRRWHRASASLRTDPVAPQESSDDVYRARLRKELEDSR
jgi:cytochrome c-type biogenesis protein CcmH